MPPSSGEQARHLLPQAGEGRKTSNHTNKKLNSLLLMLRSCPQVRFMVKTGEAPKARSGFARQVRFETKKVLVQGQEGSGVSDHAR
jgi:hypothetical protein